MDSIRTRGMPGQQMLHARLSDGTGQMHLTFFNAPSYLRDRLERGQMIRAFGKVGEYDSFAQMVNPKNRVPQSRGRARQVGLLAYACRSIAGRPTSLPPDCTVRRKRHERSVARDEETLSSELLARRRLPKLRAAIEQMHMPTSADQLASARRRLAYEELFLMQTAITLQRRFTAARMRAPRLPNSSAIDGRIRRRFPFALTPAQNRVIAEIARDLDPKSP